MQELGLTGKSLAEMNGKEVRQLTQMVLVYSKKKCVQCEQWMQKEGSSWWCGRCRVDGHDVLNNSLCSLELDKVPF